MTKRISVGFKLLATTIVAVSVVGMHTTRAIEPPIAQVPSPIDALDRHIQLRMHEQPGFGLARIGSFVRHVQDFKPETPAETRTLTELQRSGWTVGLRLGSRSLFVPVPIGPVPGGWDSDKDLSEPIAITGPKSPYGMPGRDEIREIAWRAMIGADTANSASGKVGPWSVEARVVRADRESCLKCHSRRYPTRGTTEGVGPRDRLKIGDALGVAIYVYARDRPDK